MHKLLITLALSLLALQPLTSRASIILPVDARCPLGGEPIRVYSVQSMYVISQDMDFKTYGPGAKLINSLPECPMNGFVVFKKAFTSDEVESLRSYLRSAEFLAARNESPNYRAYLMKRHLGGYSDAELAETLLRATWQADGFWQYRRYAQLALGYYTREADRLREASTKEAFHAMHLKGELSRRLLRFWDAYKVFDFQSGRPGIETTYYKAIADYEKRAIRVLWFGVMTATADECDEIILSCLIARWRDGRYRD